MSAEDDLKRNKRDSDRMFQELEDKQRRSQRAIEAQEFADALAQRGLRPEHIEKLERQIVKLGRLAGMSDVRAEEWAVSLIREAKRLIINRRATVKARGLPADCPQRRHADAIALRVEWPLQPPLAMFDESS
jgi:hypothetical protein